MIGAYKRFYFITFLIINGVLNMDYQKKLEEFVRQNPKGIFKEFLMFLRNMYKDYLSNNISDEVVSNSTVYWYATNDKFSDSLAKIDARIPDLKTGMDITHPNFSEEKKKQIVKELIRIIDEILHL